MKRSEAELKTLLFNYFSKKYSEKNIRETAFNLVKNAYNMSPNEFVKKGNCFSLPDRIIFLKYYMIIKNIKDPNEK